MDVHGVTNQVAQIQLAEDGEEESIEIPSSVLSKPTRDLRFAIVGRFLTERFIRKHEMSQIMASNWRPGKGVFIEEIKPQLFLFQFGHEVDVRRLLDSGPWAYDNHVLIMERVANGEDPEKVELNFLMLWVQVHNLPTGFMSEGVAQSIGSKIGVFMNSDPNNYNTPWRSTMRIRVRLDVRKPLKKGMKIRQAEGDWQWISFRYERLPTFCFICGLVGHGEKFCKQQYDIEEGELTRQYGPELRATSRRSNQLNVGERWLRADPIVVEEINGGNGNKTEYGKSNVAANNSEIEVDHGTPARKETDNASKGISLPMLAGNKEGSFNVSSNEDVYMEGADKSDAEEFEEDSLTYNDPKRKRGLTSDAVANFRGSYAGSSSNKDVSKNVEMAGAASQARQAQ